MKRILPILLCLVILLSACGISQEDYDAAVIEAREAGYTEGHAAGLDEGYDNGYETGHKEGYDEGYDEGNEDGYFDGYESGKSIGYDSGYADGLADQDSSNSSSNSSSTSSSGSSSSTSSYSPTVYITDTGSKYHNYGCQYLRESCHAISLSSAKAYGYGPCSRCNPPR